MIIQEARLKPEETGLPSMLDVSSSADGTPGLYSADIKWAAVEHVDATDLRWVMPDPESAAAGDSLYNVYKDVRPENLADEIERRGLMYVFTVLRGGTIRGTDEWVRTGGHIASTASGTNVRYPEVYEVLFGNGLLYMQNGTGDRVSDTAVIPLLVGDKAVVAPGWASMLVNVGTRPLVVGSWFVNGMVSRGFSEKEPDIMPTPDDPPLFHEKAELLERGGMAHYVLKDAEGAPSYAENPKYSNVPMPRTVLPKEMPEWGLSRTTPLLTAFHENPDYFRFLLRPQDYETIWKTLYD